MKWFIKCLKQYADFSGRARRKEFWMFVLFNIIFSIAWMLLLTLLFVAFNRWSSEQEINGANVANLAYSSALLLPGMAVAVRRLHDVGKSGWWLLVALTGIGAFWLLAMMLMDGRKGENKYGKNPKTSPETFSESTKLRGAGVTFIVFTFFSMLISINFLATSKLPLSMLYRNIAYFIAVILLFSVGILLLNEKNIYTIAGKMKKAIILLLLVVSILFVILNAMGITDSINIIQDINDGKFINSSYPFVKYYDIVQVIISLIIESLNFFSKLSLVFLAISLLFASLNKSLIRKAAVCTMVFSGLSLFFYTYWRMGLADVFQMTGWSLAGYMDNVLSHISFIVFAGVFLSKNGSLQRVDSYAPNQVFQKKPNVTEFNDHGMMKNDLEPDKNVKTASIQSGDISKVIFVREDRNSLGTFLTYKGTSKADAMAFLSEQHITLPSYYVVVETPDGNYGKDIQGIYKE